MKTFLPGFVLCLGLVSTQVAAAAPVSADPIWRISSAALPAGTVVRIASTTNGSAQPLFGRAHSRTYRALGRVGGRGWYEGGTLVKTGGPAPSRHTFAWIYLVSYFPDPTAAAQAVSDIKNPVPTSRFAKLGKFGRIDKSAEGGLILNFGNLVFGRIMVEQICVSGKTASQAFPGLLTRYCTKLRNRLYTILLRAAKLP